MQDQQEKLSERSIPAVELNSTLSSSEEQETIETIQSRQAELIYVTPERLENAEYLKILKKGGVSLVVVDEAHCVSQWGHDFRPAYLSLRNAIRDLGRPPVLALTATATDEVTADILKQLDFARRRGDQHRYRTKESRVRSSSYRQRRRQTRSAQRNSYRNSPAAPVLFTCPPSNRSMLYANG